VFSASSCLKSPKVAAGVSKSSPKVAWRQSQMSGRQPCQMWPNWCFLPNLLAIALIVILTHWFDFDFTIARVVWWVRVYSSLLPYLFLCWYSGRALYRPTIIMCRMSLTDCPWVKTVYCYATATLGCIAEVMTVSVTLSWPRQRQRHAQNMTVINNNNNNNL